MQGRLPAWILIQLICVIPALSETIGDPLEYLGERKMLVSLSTRVVEGGKTNHWSLDNTHIAAFGETIRLKMKGENLIILTSITPYLMKLDTILLVARGEIFISSPGRGIRYYNTVKSLPVRFGERIFFLPLGGSPGSRHKFYNIEMEISISPVAEQGE